MRERLWAGTLACSWHLQGGPYLSCCILRGMPLASALCLALVCCLCRVSVLGLVPSIVKAWRGSNCMQVGTGAPCSITLPAAAWHFSVPCCRRISDLLLKPCWSRSDSSSTGHNSDACVGEMAAFHVSLEHGCLLHTHVLQGLRWPCLRVLSSTGEASSPEDYFWLYALTRYQAPVIEYCGGRNRRPFHWLHIACRHGSKPRLNHLLCLCWRNSCTFLTATHTPIAKQAPANGVSACGILSHCTHRYRDRRFLHHRDNPSASVLFSLLYALPLHPHSTASETRPQ
jgi:hypothetical protein